MLYLYRNLSVPVHWKENNWFLQATLRCELFRKLQQKCHQTESYLFFVSKTTLKRHCLNIAYWCLTAWSKYLLAGVNIEENVYELLLRKLSYFNFQLVKFLKPSYHFIYTTLNFFLQNTFCKCDFFLAILNCFVKAILEYIKHWLKIE